MFRIQFIIMSDEEEQNVSVKRFGSFCKVLAGKKRNIPARGNRTGPLSSGGYCHKTVAVCEGLGTKIIS